MTPVDFRFVLPNGAPVANARVLIQLTRSSHNPNITGITMPRPLEITTDSNGQFTLNLWPSTVPYFIEATDTSSEATIFYRFLVPEVAQGSSVRLQDIVVDGSMSGAHYDEVALAVIHDAKASAKASELAAKAAELNAVAAQQTAASLVADLTDDVAAVLAVASQIAQEGVASSVYAGQAQTAASAAATSASTAAARESGANTAANAASTSASAASLSASDAATARADAQTASSTAQAAASTATTKAGEASGSASAAASSATAAFTSAGEAATSASNAAASAATAVQAAQDAINVSGGGVTGFNGRTGAVTLLSSDVTGALGFTPYNSSNPSGFLSMAALLAADGATSGLDADLLDGQHGSYYAAASALASKLDATANAVSATKLVTARTLTLGGSAKSFDGTLNVSWTLAEMGAQAVLTSGTNIKTVNGSSLLGAGNVDVGGTVNGLLKCNGAGTYSAAVAGTDYVTPSGSITGNAATATRLATARTINGVSFDGSANITIGTADPSYTAADVLAKLLTVDGTGSGLDADTLDGLNSSAFAQLSGANFTSLQVGGSAVWHAGNFNPASKADAGAAAILMDRGSVAAASLDAATQNGYYTVTYAGDSRSLLTFNASGSTGPLQMLFSYTGSMEVRNKTDSTTWTAWKSLWHSGNFNPANYAPLTGGGTSGTWPINISGTAAAASSVAWSNVSGRPTNVSSFTNDMGYIGSASLTWANISGKPTAVSAFTNDAGYLTSVSWSAVTGKPTGVSAFTNDAGYLTSVAWTAVTGKPTNVSTWTNDSGYITSASLTWANIANKPTAVSAFTNDSGYVTTANIGSYALPLSGGTVSGSITATGNITAYSDMRLKRDIEPIRSALSKVLALNGVTFRRLAGDKRYTGLLAQDVQCVLPEAVQQTEDGFLSVAYGNLVGLLVEAIKELKGQLDER